MRATRAGPFEGTDETNPDSEVAPMGATQNPQKLRREWASHGGPLVKRSNVQHNEQTFPLLILYRNETAEPPATSISRGGGPFNPHYNPSLVMSRSSFTTRCSRLGTHSAFAQLPSVRSKQWVSAAPSVNLWWSKL